MISFKFCWIRWTLKNYYWMGFLWFNFIDTSKRKISFWKAKEIINDIKSKWFVSIKLVWLFDDKYEVDNILSIMDYVWLDSIQLYSDNFEKYKYLRNKWYFLVKPITIWSSNDIVKYSEVVDLFIIDWKNPWSGKSYDYDLIDKLDINKDYLIAWGINSDNILQVYEKFKEKTFFKWFDVASFIDNWKNIDKSKMVLLNDILNNR